MRVSVDKDDPGHRAYLESREQGYTWLVWLDGIRQDDVHTADDFEGLVVRPALDPEGRLTADENGAIVMEECRGRVVLKRRYRAPSSWGG